MESFELIDNFFQIVVLLCAAAAAGIFALRRRSRDLLILSLAYACFAMGTMYYVLYLVIIGIWPQVSMWRRSPGWLRGSFTYPCKYCGQRG